MRINKLKSCLLLSALVLSACTLGLVKNTPENITKAEAATSETKYDGKAGSVLYVKSNSTFYSGCKFSVYFFNTASDSAWVWNKDYYCYEDNGNRYFPIITPGAENKQWNNVIVCRTNASQKNPDWNYVYNQTSDITITSISNNVVEITGWGSGNTMTTDLTKSYTHYGIKSGEAIYIEANKGEYDSDGAKLTVNFGVADRDSNGSVFSAFATKVQNTSSGDHLYEMIVPQLNNIDVIWNRVIAVRCNSSATEPSWDSKWNQTGDMFYNNNCKNNNVLKVDFTNWGIEYQITDAQRAGYFGEYFLQKCPCTGTSSSISSNDWNDTKNEYNRMALLAQGEFWKAKYDKTEETDKLIMAATRYDYLIWKYGTSTYVNYANRSVTPKSVIVFPNLFTELTDATANCTLIVLITTGVALMAFGGYFFLKKKKED